MAQFKEEEHPRDNDGKFKEKGASDRVNELVDKYSDTPNTNEDKIPFAGGLLNQKQYVDDYPFTGSKWGNEEADVYNLKDGTNLVFQSMGDPSYQKITPQQAIRVWNKVPDWLKRFAQKEIEFVDYYNPEDSYWQQVYVGFEHAFATSGSKITFYRNDKSLTTDSQVFYALCHEIGHNFDKKLSQTTKYASEWENIIIQDGDNRVSEYAKNHIREDFADSVALYVSNPSKFQKDFPSRFNFLEKWLKGGKI